MFLEHFQLQWHTHELLNAYELLIYLWASRNSCGVGDKSYALTAVQLLQSLSFPLRCSLRRHLLPSSHSSWCAGNCWMKSPHPSFNAPLTWATPITGMVSEDEMVCWMITGLSWGTDTKLLSSSLAKCLGKKRMISLLRVTLEKLPWRFIHAGVKSIMEESKIQ